MACAEARRYNISHENIRLISMGTGAYVPGLLDESSWRSKQFSTGINMKIRGSFYWATHFKNVGLKSDMMLVIQIFLCINHMEINIVECLSQN